MGDRAGELVGVPVTVPLAGAVGFIVGDDVGVEVRVGVADGVVGSWAPHAEAAACTAPNALTIAEDATFPLSPAEVVPVVSSAFRS